MAPPRAGEAHWAASARARSPRSSARWIALGCPRRGALVFFIGDAARADRRDRQGTRLAPCIPTPQSVICELICEGVRYIGIPLSESATPHKLPFFAMGMCLVSRARDHRDLSARWIILTRIFRFFGRIAPFQTRMPHTRKQRRIRCLLRVRGSRVGATMSTSFQV
ncbi:hypothetical protein DFH09DRAFT_1195278 [Mycena vulgaris]|nr:hypothetical protein DFH09DRAFT_1195278 [Mycena vulgaris]